MLTLEEKIKEFLLDPRKNFHYCYCTLHVIASLLAALFLGSDVLSRGEKLLGSSGDSVFKQTLITTFYYHFILL